MKKLILLSLLVGLSATSYSQVYSKGAKLVNLGVGLGPGIGGNAAVDLGVHEMVSVGVFGGYNVWNTLNYGRISAGGRLSVHLADILKKADVEIDESKLDPYIGIQAGLGKFTGSYIGTIEGIHLIYGGHLGARYMIKGKLGVFGEVGYDTSYLKGGLTFKL